MRFNLFWTVMWLALSPNLAGCALEMARLRYEGYHQGRYGDASVLERGADREHVTDRLGAPIASVTREDGTVVDLYRFDPNKPEEAPFRWGALHWPMSVLTFGLWEVVGVPIEEALKERPLTYLLVYDGDGKLAELEAARQWLPASVAEVERRNCELLGSFAALRVATPPAAENPLAQIKVSRDRDEAYHRALLGCMLKHYARR